MTAEPDTRDAPRPEIVVCDVCQELPACVTIGCVEYCARCAPNWADGERGGVAA